MIWTMENEEELTVSWRDTAMRLAKEALSLYGDQEYGLIGFVIEHVEDMVKETVEVNYLDEAYKTVYDANINDHEVFKQATEQLINLDFDINKDKIDTTDIITRLAYWIIYIKAMQQYWELVEKEEVIADD